MLIYFLPRVFTILTIVAVYIPPQDKTKIALEKLHENINTQLTAHFDSVLIVAGDFNHIDLKLVMSKLHRHVDLPIRENKVLYQVYTNAPEAFNEAHNRDGNLELSLVENQILGG